MRTREPAAERVPPPIWRARASGRKRRPARVWSAGAGRDGPAEADEPADAQPQPVQGRDERHRRQADPVVARQVLAEAQRRGMGALAAGADAPPHAVLDDLGPHRRAVQRLPPPEHRAAAGRRTPAGAHSDGAPNGPRRGLTVPGAVDLAARAGRLIPRRWARRLDGGEPLGGGGRTILPVAWADRLGDYFAHLRGVRVLPWIGHFMPFEAPTALVEALQLV